MATFTITSDTNIDALSGKAGDDTYNINGNFTLTIDQDTRGGLNNDTSSIMGPVNPSATLGGNVNINAEGVRLIPYNTGTGNVPAWNTAIAGTTGLVKLFADGDDSFNNIWSNRESLSYS